MKKSTLSESVVRLAIHEPESMPVIEPVILPIGIQIEINMDIFISLESSLKLEKTEDNDENTSLDNK
jgi:hypothetical protein